MIRALSGMGGGGQRDPTAANNANTAIYATFAISGVLSGGLFNVLGPRLMLPAGCMACVLLAGSFLNYNHTQNEAFMVVSGVIAGVGVVGGLIPFFLNFHRQLDSVNDATYIAFMCFMAAGALISMAILPPSQVIREDGSQCTLVTNQSKVSTEAIEILKLFTNWKMLLIAPAAWASNFFYAYEFNNGLNNVSYWGAQMVGSIFIGYVFDFGFKSRRHRGFLGIGTVFVIGTVIWCGGLVNQLGYSFGHTPYPKLDFIESGVKFMGPFVLYFSYGFFDAIFQSMIYWVIGALAEDTETLSRIQSAGAAVAWQLDTRKVAMLNQLVINWALTTISYPLLTILVALAVVDDDLMIVKKDELESS
ncbi:UNC93-like protein 2 [Linum perenne]